MRYKVLMVYADAFSDGILPIGISTLVSVLKPHFEVRLFDTTFYPGKFTDIRKWREKTLEYKKLDGELYHLNETDVNEDFEKVYKDFKPDIIGVSATSSDFPVGLSLLSSTVVDIPIIFGGIHATIAPEDIISHPKVDYIFRGEAEHIIVDLFTDIIEGNDLSKHHGLWYKKDGKIHKSDVVPLVEDMDSLPCPDWSLFDERHFLRPFKGKGYRLGTFELSRGCPFSCTYCINHTIQKLTNKKKQYREKNIDIAFEHIKYLTKKYRINLIKFWDECFLGHKKSSMEFLKRYKDEIGIPYMIQTRPEGITKEFAKALKESNCVNLSIGLESGSEYTRTHHLKRFMTDEQIITGFQNCKTEGLRTTTFLIMGLPEETREDVFKGIRLIKKCEPTVCDTFFLFPYKGTEIREWCINNGWMTQDQPRPEEHGDTHFHYILKNPNFTIEELRKLRKTFPIYVKTDEKYWDIIKKAEDDDHLYEFLNNVYGRIIHE